MEILNLIFYFTMLILTIFMFAYNWIYAVRIKTSSIKIGMETPAIVNTFIAISIFVSLTTILVTSFALAFGYD